jgi:hypothetical protein
VHRPAWPTGGRGMGQQSRQNEHCGACLSATCHDVLGGTRRGTEWGVGWAEWRWRRALHGSVSEGRLRSGGTMLKRGAGQGAYDGK